MGAKRGKGVRDSQLWRTPPSCKLQGTLSFTGHSPTPDMHAGIIFSIQGEQYHRLLRLPWFLQSRGACNSTGQSCEDAHIHCLQVGGSARQRAAEHRFSGDSASRHEHWDWSLLECRTSDSAGSYMGWPGLFTAPWGQTPDGRGKWETGSQTGQHFRHLSQLGSVGRAFCLPLSPVSLACPAASRQENLRQQSSGVRAVPLLQYIDQSSLKESGLDIWDTYWLLHWLSSCPDPHSLGTAWITCPSMLGPVSPDLKGLLSQLFAYLQPV